MGDVMEGLRKMAPDKAADIRNRRLEMEYRLFKWHNDHDDPGNKLYACGSLGVAFIYWFKASKGWRVGYKDLYIIPHNGNNANLGCYPRAR